MSTGGATIANYPTTTAQGIVLIHAGLTLTITRFGSFPSAYPRLDGQYPTLTYSLRGNAAREGRLFRPKSIWTFDALLDLEQQATWQRMEAAYLATPAAFTLYDYTRPWADSGTRSRGLAPNSTEDATGGRALYYAAFNAEPTRAARFVERSGNDDLLTFQFQETEATAP